MKVEKYKQQLERAKGDAVEALHAAPGKEDMSRLDQVKQMSDALKQAQEELDKVLANSISLSGYALTP